MRVGSRQREREQALWAGVWGALQSGRRAQEQREATGAGQGTAGYRAQGHSSPSAPVAPWGPAQAGMLSRGHSAGEICLNP